MPYTSPRHASPASSASTSPDISRRPSFHQPPMGNGRPMLPRSLNYTKKHRRTPSAGSDASRHEPSPEATSEDLKAMVANSSVRQSPPPLTGENGMPKGAIISPPDSSSDDDDLPELRGQARGRPLDNLKALHQAISQLPQHRSGSPPKEEVEQKKTSDEEDLLALSSQAGVISEDSESETQQKPQMVRKKSGELVRPALRGSGRRRPSSMPGTPTFSKAVHFDSHLEHVRHFLQVDRPLAVSAGSSPVGDYESDTEYPFGGDDRSAVRTPPFEWEIVMNNLPMETPARKALPVRLERVWLTPDQKSLIGSVAVANLAFHKNVACRFTLDYWKTTSEVAAEYVAEILPAETPVSRDRFNFNIKLSDLANLESKTLYFCIRYNVNGQEHWDNNGGMNFQADFRKKALAQNGKKGVIGAASRPLNGLPKSTRRANPSTAPRPRSMPPSADDFGDGKVNLNQSIHDYLGESEPTSIRLKTSKSASSLPSDNLSSRLSAPSGQAFANRYDFGASLTAAIQNAKDTMSKPDGLYMKSSKKASTVVPPVKTNPASTITTITPRQTPAVTAPDSPSASISSSSYEELVNKYCFFGTKHQNGSRFDGADDTKSTNSSTTSSYEGSPVQMGNYQHYHSGTQHHSLRPKDPNPYFQPGVFLPIVASPSESPLNNFSSQQIGGSVTLSSRASGASASGRTSPPASSVGTFAHLAGTPDDYPYQQMPDRFPFTSSDSHAPTAIRG